MSMTMEQVVTQLQQEQFTPRAQVAEASGLADAKASSQQSRDSSSSERYSESRLAPPSQISSLAVRRISNSGQRKKGGNLRWCDRGV